MPKFNVTVMFTVPHYATAPIEAATREEAESQAIELAEEGQFDFEADYHAAKRPDYEIAACELVYDELPPETGESR